MAKLPRSLADAHSRLRLSFVEGPFGLDDESEALGLARPPRRGF